MFPFVSIFFCYLSDIRRSDFSHFLIVGSAKVRIFFKLPNKINFIFSSSFSSLFAFQYADADQLPVLPIRAAKVAIFSAPAIFILK